MSNNRPTQLKRTDEQYNEANTEIRLHNLVETWLLDSEGYLVALYNIKNSQTTLFSYSTISVSHATELILRHLIVSLARDRAHCPDDHERINVALRAAKQQLAKERK